MDRYERTFRFHVSGMHCASCVLLTESDLSEASQVASAKADLGSRTVKVTGDFGNRTESEVVDLLNPLLSKHGYALSSDAETDTVRWEEFRVAVPVFLAIVLVLYAIAKSGIVDLVPSGDVTVGTAFLIGVVASLSTCVAMVGGIVLSLSASAAREGGIMRTQALFQIGRIAGFFVLGGLLGSLGSALSPSPVVSSVLGLVASLVMIVLGADLLGVFPWAKRLLPAMPKALSRRALVLTRVEHVFAPVIAGVATFFLPCGFTQSMQFYALSTGSFLYGATTMLSFSLGTLPVLFLIGVGPFGSRLAAKTGAFSKVMGLVVILFGMIGILGGLAVLGIVPPVIGF